MSVFIQNVNITLQESQTLFRIKVDFLELFYFREQMHYPII